jgi:uracil-DNA glycosylase
MTYDPRAHGCECDSCPLKGQQVVPPEGNPDARFAVVNEAPGLSELKFGKQWIGPAGAKLNELLFKAGLHRNQIWMTSALLCRPEVPGKEGRRRFDVKEYVAWIRRENVKIRRENKANKKSGLPGFIEYVSPLDCCAPRLYGELHALDQKARAAGAPNGLVVVPLGSFALGLLTTKPGAMQSILKYRGSVIFPKEST